MRLTDTVACRSFELRDLDALYRIALETGHAGGDASHLYNDPKMMGHIYAAPYASLDPEFALVVEDESGVAGFVVGTEDTAAWEGRLEREWWPSLRRRYPDPDGLDPALWTADQRRASMIHRPTSTPAAIASTYPSHLHMNLLPRLRHRGVGSALARVWFDVAARRGVMSVHVAVNRHNVGAIGFWTRQAFAEVRLEGVPNGRTIWMGRHGMARI